MQQQFFLSSRTSRINQLVVFWVFFLFYIIFSKPQFCFVFQLPNGHPKSTFHPKEFLVWSGYWERSLWFCTFRCISCLFFGFGVFFEALGHNHKSHFALEAKFQYSYQEHRLRRLRNFSSSLRRTLGNMSAELFGGSPAHTASFASAYKSHFCQKLNLKQY